MLLLHFRFTYLCHPVLVQLYIGPGLYSLCVQAGPSIADPGKDENTFMFTRVKRGGHFCLTLSQYTKVKMMRQFIR